MKPHTRRLLIAPALLANVSALVMTSRTTALRTIAVRLRWAVQQDDGHNELRHGEVATQSSHQDGSSRRRDLCRSHGPGVFGSIRCAVGHRRLLRGKDEQSE